MNEQYIKEMHPTETIEASGQYKLTTSYSRRLFNIPVAISKNWEFADVEVTETDEALYINREISNKKAVLLSIPVVIVMFSIFLFGIYTGGIESPPIFIYIWMGFILLVPFFNYLLGTNSRYAIIRYRKADFVSDEKTKELRTLKFQEQKLNGLLESDTTINLKPSDKS